MPFLKPKRLYTGNDINMTLYQTPSNTNEEYSIIKSIVFCAPEGSVTISLHLLPDTVFTPSNSNVLISNVVVDANSTLSYDTSIVMNSGDSLYVTASSSHPVSTNIFGVEYS